MRTLVIVLVSISAMLAGFYLSAKHFAQPMPGPQQTSMSSQSLAPTTDLVGALRPDFSLASNSGETVSVADFSGKTILINFWATWCAPCREEMPVLMELQRQHQANGLQVVGIALDNAESVKSFVQTYGISYPILIGDADVFETSAAYGNIEGVLPYSVLIDKSGIVRWQYAGKLHMKDINLQLSSLL